MTSAQRARVAVDLVRQMVGGTSGAQPPAVNACLCRFCGRTLAPGLVPGAPCSSYCDSEALN